MSGFNIGTAMDAAFMMLGGYGFAHLGWAGVRRRAPEPAPGQELASPPPMSSAPWKLVWGLLLLFGAFVCVCGVFLALSTILPESGS